jgi:DNA uptake protein ComE-like DNA-binding protein
MPDRIDLNAASEAELCDVLEIDAGLATRILERRAQHGDFTSIGELAGIEGVDRALLRLMEQRLTVAAVAEPHPAP